MESERREIQAFFWRGWRSPNLGPVGELEGPGNRLETTNLLLQSPHYVPPPALAQALRSSESLPHTCLCNLLAVAIFLGLSL